MISILCHLYHHNLWEEISASIKRAKFEKKIYVNLTNDKPVEEISRAIKKDFPKVTILVSNNQGKDIGGNLRLIGQWLKDGAPGDLLTLCHSKIKNTSWRKELFSSLFVDYVEFLFKNPNVGMVGHKNWIYQRSNDVNSRFYNEYCKRFGFTDTSMRFVAGTMFCARSSIFKSFFSKHDPVQLANELEYGDVYEPSRTHAWERLYGAIVRPYAIMPAGRYENFNPLFNEKHYLEKYPDVKLAILQGKFSSGLEHYMEHGIREGRVFKDPRDSSKISLL